MTDAKAKKQPDKQPDKQPEEQAVDEVAAQAMADRVIEIIEEREHEKRLAWAQGMSLLWGGAAPGGATAAPKYTTEKQRHRGDVLREYRQLSARALQHVIEGDAESVEGQVAAEVLAERTAEKLLRDAHPDGAPIAAGGETFAQLARRLRKPKPDGQGGETFGLLPEEAVAKIRGLPVTGERWLLWEAGKELPTGNELAALAEGFNLPLADVEQARVVQQHEGPRGLVDIAAGDG